MSLRASGKLNVQIGADVPTFAVFDKEAVRTYTAFNPDAAARTVKYTDGFEMEVPAKTQVTKTGPVRPILVGIRDVSRGRMHRARPAAYVGWEPLPASAGLQVFDLQGRRISFGGSDGLENPPFRRAPAPGAYLIAPTQP
jgi:hypothetical protein